MAAYELRLFMRNACGPALLGEVAVFEAASGSEAMSEASQRVRRLPRYCSGVLYDSAGVQIWTDDSPGHAPPG
jgi:hypothetical protein